MSALLLAVGCKCEPGKAAPAPAASAEPQTSAAPESSLRSPSECPNGTYELTNLPQSMTIDAPGVMEVEREAGSILCGFPAKEQFRCASKGYELTGAFKDPPLSIALTITGGTTVHYVSAGAGRWKTVRADSGEFQVSGHVEKAGEKSSWPEQPFFEPFTKVGAIIEYTCKENTLEMKAEGVKAPWILVRR